jgi:hypothetical protein
VRLRIQLHSPDWQEAAQPGSCNWADLLIVAPQHPLVVSVAVMVVLESMGIRLMVYKPFPPVTLPSEADTTSPVVERLTE